MGQGWRIGEQFAHLKYAHAEQNTSHTEATRRRQTPIEVQKDEAIQAHTALVALLLTDAARPCQSARANRSRYRQRRL